MKLWILSDLHCDRGVGDIAVHTPEFDVLVCAGDVVSGDISMSIEMVAAPEMFAWVKRWKTQ